MNAVRDLTIALIKSGMDPVEATILIARAGVEMAPPTDTRSVGAKRQAAWRERNKASQSVTNETHNETSQIVTERLETSQRDNASLSKKEKKEEIKKEKKEGRASQIPVGWRPDEQRWTVAVAKLGSAERADAELRKFTNHALSKGRVCKNWNAAWDNWVEKALEWKNGHGTSSVRTHPAAEQSGSASILAGVAAATERRARERTAAGRERQVPGNADPAEASDPELFGGSGSAATPH